MNKKSGTHKFTFCLRSADLFSIRTTDVTIINVSIYVCLYVLTEGGQDIMLINEKKKNIHYTLI